MARRFMLVLALIALVPALADAGTTVRVRANHPSDVFLDGSRVGRTPLVIPDLRGRHDLTIRSRITGETSVSRVRGNWRRDRFETVAARFSGGARPGYYGNNRFNDYRPYGYRWRRW